MTGHGAARVGTSGASTTMSNVPSPSSSSLAPLSSTTNSSSALRHASNLSDGGGHANKSMARLAHLGTYRRTVKGKEKARGSVGARGQVVVSPTWGQTLAKLAPDAAPQSRTASTSAVPQARSTATSPGTGPGGPMSILQQPPSDPLPSSPQQPRLFGDDPRPPRRRASASSLASSTHTSPRPSATLSPAPVDPLLSTLPPINKDANDPTLVSPTPSTSSIGSDSTSSSIMVNVGLHWNARHGKSHPHLVGEPGPMLSERDRLGDIGSENVPPHAKVQPTMGGGPRHIFLDPVVDRRPSPPPNPQRRATTAVVTAPPRRTPSSDLYVPPHQVRRPSAPIPASRSRSTVGLGLFQEMYEPLPGSRLALVAAGKYPHQPMTALGRELQNYKFGGESVGLDVELGYARKPGTESPPKPVPTLLSWRRPSKAQRTPSAPQPPPLSPEQRLEKEATEREDTIESWKKWSLAYKNGVADGRRVRSESEMSERERDAPLYARALSTRSSFDSFGDSSAGAASRGRSTSLASSRYPLLGQRGRSASDTATAAVASPALPMKRLSNGSAPNSPDVMIELAGRVPPALPSVPHPPVASTSRIETLNLAAEPPISSTSTSNVGGPSSLSPSSSWRIPNPFATASLRRRFCLRPSQPLAETQLLIELVVVLTQYTRLYGLDVKLFPHAALAAAAAVAASAASGASRSPRFFRVPATLASTMARDTSEWSERTIAPRRARGGGGKSRQTSWDTEIPMGTGNDSDADGCGVDKLVVELDALVGEIIDAVPAFGESLMKGTYGPFTNRRWAPPADATATIVERYRLWGPDGTLDPEEAALGRYNGGRWWAQRLLRDLLEGFFIDGTIASSFDGTAEWPEQAVLSGALAALIEEDEEDFDDGEVVMSPWEQELLERGRQRWLEYEARHGVAV